MAGQTARVADEKVREALEAIIARFDERDDKRAQEISTLVRLQSEHTVECTGIRRSETQRWESFTRVADALATRFKEHCDADALFQNEERADRDKTRFWIWSSLVTAIVISWGVIGWLVNAVMHVPHP